MEAITWSSACFPAVGNQMGRASITKNKSIVMGSCPIRWQNSPRKIKASYRMSSLVHAKSDDEWELEWKVIEETSTTPRMVAKSLGAPPPSECRLLALCAATNRGQSASASQKVEIDSMISQLERSSGAEAVPASNPLLNGEWTAVYASEDITRTSPFFWAFRGLCKDITQPLPGLPSSLSEALFAITDGIPFSSVGKATHSISGVGVPGQDIKLVSKVSVKISLMDAFLPPSVGNITSTAVLKPIGDSKHNVTVLTTQVKDSTWAQLPMLNAVDNVTFPSREVFAALRDGSQTTEVETTYLSENLRITKAGQTIMVHARVAM